MEPAAIGTGLPSATKTGPDMNFKITDRALKKLRDTVSKEALDLSSVLLRVAVVPGGCSGLTYELGWDTTLQESDEKAKVEEFQVVMDLKSRLYVDGAALDYTEGLDGRGFHFDNPQAVRTCACGESFGL